MKLKLTAAMAALPEDFLLLLKDTGYLQRFTSFEITEGTGLNAIMPAPYTDESLARLAIDMCHFWSERIGPPARTSLTDCWIDGDVLFSAEWVHVGWVLSVAYYRDHPSLDDAAIAVRIKRARPGSMLKLVHSNMLEPAT